MKTSRLMEEFIERLFLLLFFLIRIAKRR